MTPTYSKHSLWDFLPDDCKDIILEKKRQIDCAVLIQKHYRKVRYSPEQLSNLCSRYKLNCATSSLIGRNVVIQWHPSTGKKFEIGKIAWGKKRFKKYDCAISYNSRKDSYVSYRGETVTYSINDFTYWYNPKSGEKIATSTDPRIVNIRNTYNILSCALIKPW